MNKQELLASLLEVIDRKPEDIPLDARERIERYKNISAVKVNNNLLKERDKERLEKEESKATDEAEEGDRE